MTPAGTIPRELLRLQRPGLLGAGVGIALMIVGLFVTSHSFFRAYLFAWLCCLGISLGCLAIVMLSFLVNGDWGWIVRRFAEAAAVNLPLLAVLFIPIILGRAQLFPWAHEEWVRSDHVLAHRAPYMNTTFFTLRAIVYFAVWIGLAFSLRGLSLAYDRTGELALLRRAQRLSAAGLVIYILTMTLASVDWIMTRDPHWFSHAIGFIVVIGQAASGMAFVTLLVTRVADRDPIAPVLEPRILNDLGNLLLTLVILFTYVSFAQLLVLWMGNLKDDVSYYVDRGFNPTRPNAWRWVAAALMLFHFFLPFFILLGRENKRRARTLGSIAVLLLVMRMVDVYFWTAPTDLHPPNVEYAPGTPNWLDIPAVLAMGGVWLVLYVWNLEGQSLLPRTVPPVEDVVAAH
jgi:hypothetical protein